MPRCSAATSSRLSVSILTDLSAGRMYRFTACVYPFVRAACNAGDIFLHEPLRQLRHPPWATGARTVEPHRKLKMQKVP